MSTGICVGLNFELWMSTADCVGEIFSRPWPDPPCSGPWAGPVTRTLAYLLTSILAYSHTCKLGYSHTCKLAYLHTCKLAYSHTCKLGYPHTCLLAHFYPCILAHLQTCSHTCTWKLAHFYLASLYCLLVHTCIPADLQTFTLSYLHTISHALACINRKFFLRILEHMKVDYGLIRTIAGCITLTANISWCLQNSDTCKLGYRSNFEHDDPSCLSTLDIHPAGYTPGWIYTLYIHLAGYTFACISRQIWTWWWWLDPCLSRLVPAH